VSQREGGMEGDAAGAPSTEDPLPVDPFNADDPEAQERERRRLERERRRREGKDRRSRSGRRRALGSRVRDSLAGKGAAAPERPPTREEPLPPREPTTSERAEAALPSSERLAEPSTEERRRIAHPPPPSVARRRRTVAIIGVVIAAAFAWFLIALFQPFGGDGHGKVVVRVPKGSTAGEIGDILDNRGVVSSGALFQLRLKLAGKSDDVQAGTYTLASGMSYGKAIDELTTPANQRQVTVVIPEGYSRDQISQLTSDAGVKGNYEQATVRSKLLNPASYGAQGAKDLEGFLFPATYELKPRSDTQDLVDQQLTAFKQQIKGVDMSYAKSKNLTVYDVLTIASMVDREVQVAKERPLVAAVIYNRLAAGEPLGIDSTTRFATHNYTKPLTQSDLNSPSPYNTRLNAGLPPGPIGNPGIAAIKAAAKPSKVNYRFFVVKPGVCGKHFFTASETEFEKAADKYNSARQAAGGKSPDTC
jgi:peptidoglycan lytic transglycosylase G